MAVGGNRSRWLLLATGNEKDQDDSEKCSDVTPATKPTFLLRHNTAHGCIPLSQHCPSRIGWRLQVTLQRAAAIFIVHLSARYAQTRLAPSPCLSLTTDPELPSVAPAKCNTKYSPERSAYVRRSRFMMRPSGVLTRFIANTDYQARRKQTKKKNQ